MQFKKIDAWFGLNGVWFAQLWSCLYQNIVFWTVIPTSYNDKLTFTYDTNIVVKPMNRPLHDAHNSDNNYTFLHSQHVTSLQPHRPVTSSCIHSLEDLSFSFLWPLFSCCVFFRFLLIVQEVQLGLFTYNSGSCDQF